MSGGVTAGPGLIVWMMGYEKRGLGSVLEALAGAGVRRLIDVRENPRSRKPGFHRTTLRGVLAAHGVEYVHLGELGCRRVWREALHQGGSWAAYERAYETHLRTVPASVDELERLVRQRPSVVLCMERRAEACHRLILARHLSERGLRTVEL